MSKLRFFYIFFLKPGLTKTFYLMKDYQFSLGGAVCFMLENFKKKFMIWVVTVMHFVPYLVGFVWSWAFQKCPNFECPSTFKLPSQLSSCELLLKNVCLTWSYLKLFLWSKSSGFSSRSWVFRFLCDELAFLCLHFQNWNDWETETPLVAAIE